MRIVALGLALLCACGSSSKDPAPASWDRYDGEAYPDQRPKTSWPPGNYAIVPSAGSDTLAVVDLDARKVVANVPVGKSPVVRDGPHHVVADPAARKIYLLEGYPD